MKLVFFFLYLEIVVGGVVEVFVVLGFGLVNNVEFGLVIILVFFFVWDLMVFVFCFLVMMGEVWGVYVFGFE